MAFTWGNIERVFQAPEVHEEFQREGYVLIEFLSPEQITTMRELFAHFHPEGVSGFHTTTFDTRESYRRQVHNEILSQIEGNIAQLFEAYKVYFCSFIAKAPGPDSELILHQDMTLLDESRFNGINIWCPLVDLTPENGALHVLPGSHRIAPTYRSSSLPDLYDQVKSEVRAYMKVLTVPAGTAIVFDQSIMHYSPPNLSGEVRPVINTFVAHEDSEIITAYANTESGTRKCELFRQNDAYFFENQQFGANIFDRPALGESMGIVDYDFPLLEKSDLEKRYGPLPAQVGAQRVPSPPRRQKWWWKLLGKSKQSGL